MHVVNSQQFRGLRGIQLYAAMGTEYPEFVVYADEEMIRWASRLLRHYAIEGKTGMCSSDPYMMAHLKNGDFTRGLNEWQLSPAEPGSIKASRFAGLGLLEGRWPNPGGVGDTVLAMRL